MKRLSLIVICVAAALYVSAAARVPDLGNPSIVVLANNLQNYYYNYSESDRPSYDTDEGRAAKTRKIVQMMIDSKADIFAFCEVEAKPIVLQQLVDSLNKTVGATLYATINDGINVATDSYDNAIKSGFVYRTDRVSPYGSNYAATNVTYYKNVMRIQAWEETATGERFTLSMNHFKAKTDAASIAKRVDNANWLMTGLSTSSKVKDPDILIMGDFNCESDEEAYSIIVNKGYEEQLLRYDPDAYSYIYRSTHELIDHAFANSSMASQITGAAVWHTNTSASYSSRYSDHDAVMVGLRLGKDTGTGIEAVDATEGCVKQIRHGQLIIIRGGQAYTITGQRL